jgi:hypothetical protein
MVWQGGWSISLTSISLIIDTAIELLQRPEQELLSHIPR